jgi:transposase
MPTTNRRTAAALVRTAREARRLRAAELIAQGRSQAQVAHELGVSRESARRWHHAFKAGGAQALRSRGPTGPAPAVADEQLPAIQQALLQGAKAHGFDNDLWTLDRITSLVERLTGVRLHPSTVWRLLHRRLGWSVQRPRRQAKERDEEAIQRWVAYEWPRIKRGLARNRPATSGRSRPPPDHRPRRTRRAPPDSVYNILGCCTVFQRSDQVDGVRMAG